METGKMKLALSAGALALSMALAGCGGGGSNSVVSPTTPSTTDPTSSTDSAALFETATDSVTAVKTALEMLPGDATATDDQETAVSDAITKAKDDIAAAEAAGADTATPKTDLAKYEGQFTERMKAIDAAQKATSTAADKARTDKAEALMKAISSPSRPSSDARTIAGARLATNTATGITPYRTIGFHPGGDSGTEVLFTLDKETAIADRDGWKGAEFKGDNSATGDNKVTGTLRAYFNKAGPTMTAFPAGTDNSIPGLTRSGNTGPYSVATPAMAAEHIAGAGFATLGVDRHNGDLGNTDVDGTYKGVSGRFTCTESGGCTSTYRDDGILLSAGWVFRPNPGAMLPVEDSEYLEFGWWKREDKDGDPTHAGIFHRQVGYVLPTAGDDPANAYRGNGSATYSGQAAGLFAVVRPLAATEDNSGYFTADASLTATLGVTLSDQTLMGTIDNFKLNDGTENPDWSIELEKVSRIEDQNQFTSTSTAQTVWSIGDDIKGERGGRWSATMYNVPATDTADASLVPDVVIGEFEAAIGGTHKMIGAFGAERSQN